MSLNTAADRSFHARWVLVIEDLRDQAELCLDVCAQAGLNTTAAAAGRLSSRFARAKAGQAVIHALGEGEHSIVDGPPALPSELRRPTSRFFLTATSIGYCES